MIMACVTGRPFSTALALEVQAVASNFRSAGKQVLVIATIVQSSKYCGGTLKNPATSR